MPFNQELIEWTRYPEPLESLAQSPVFGCTFTDRKSCSSRAKKVCNLKHRGDNRPLRLCAKQCPKTYPW